MFIAAAQWLSTATPYVNNPFMSTILAATSSPGTDVIGLFAQYGLVGAIVIDALLTRKLLIPRGTYDEALKQRDQRISERDAIIVELKLALTKLQESTREEILPALIKANELQGRYIKILTDEQRPGER